MVLSSNYELVEVAGEFLAVPVGEMAEKTKDVFTFSKAAGFLMGLLKEPKTEEEMIEAIVREYELDAKTAEIDVKEFMSSVRSYGLVNE